MNVQRLRQFRPKWTIGTLLIAAGWSSVAVWMNTTPRLTTYDYHVTPDGWVIPDQYVVEYGYPWTHASGFFFGKWSKVSQGDGGWEYRPWKLAGNVAVGIGIILILTFISKYLLSRIVSALNSSNGERDLVQQ